MNKIYLADIEDDDETTCAFFIFVIVIVAISTEKKMFSIKSVHASHTHFKEWKRSILCTNYFFLVHCMTLILEYWCSISSFFLFCFCLKRKKKILFRDFGWHDDDDWNNLIGCPVDAH